MKTLVGIAAAFVVGATVVPMAPATAATAAANSTVSIQALPPGSVRRAENRYWTWFGPRNWSASYGTYGITIVGPNKRVLDYGFSTTVCSSATTALGSANAYFAARRRDLTRSGVAQLRLTVGKVTRMPAASFGVNYFRQAVTFTGVSGRVAIRGEVIFDYRVSSNLYCFTRSQSRTAPAVGYALSISQLRSIQSSLAYFGPGA